MKKNYYKIFIFLLFGLFYFNFSFAQNIQPSEQICNSPSDCSSYGNCCMVDLYSDPALLNYYTCIARGSTNCIKPNSSTTVNKCWPSVVCEKGLEYVINPPVNGICGEAIGYKTFSSSDIQSLKTNNKFCSSGTLSSDPKLNTSTKVWSWTCVGSNNGTSASCSLTLPPVGVNASSYNLTLQTVTGGTISSSKLSGYNANETATITATPKSGYTFTRWAGDCSASGSSSSCTLVMNGDKTVSAVFYSSAVVPVTYNLTLQTVTGGTISSSKLSGYSLNSTATITATPSSGYTFTRWAGDCSSAGTNATCTISMNSDKTVSASFYSSQQTVDPYKHSDNEQISGVCVNYSSALESEPTILCSAGVSGTVSLRDGKFDWMCFGKNGGANSVCSVDVKKQPVVIIPEKDPFFPLQSDPLVQPKNGSTSSSSGSSSTSPSSSSTGGTVSDFPVIPQKSASINTYPLLENYSRPCVIKFDSECEVIDQKFLDAIKASSSILDAISSGKLNGDWKVAKTSGTNPVVEVDNYKTGFTLSNIQKLRKARVLPVGMELAASCIAGQIPCADGYIYDGYSSSDVATRTVITSKQNYEDCKTTGCHAPRMPDTTLNQVLAGYSNCNAYSQNLNSPFCHLVNPNWILKDPKYMCESGTKNGPLLYVTDTQSQSNIRYQSCPDVSTCLSETNNGDCLSYGYCLREKNIWRFNLSADSCSSQSVGCAKYTYNIGDKKTTLGFIKETTDKADCDSSNSGCRKYSLNKVGSGSSEWSRGDADKIFLNGNIKACDSTNEGCTAFIRRDSANLIKNSSFEEYELSVDLSTKNALIWTPLIQNQQTNTLESVSLEGSNDGTPVFNGSNSLVLRRSDSAGSSGYVGYSLKNDYFIDVEPNKTYTLSYYVLGYGISFTQDDLVASRGAYVNVKEYNQSKSLIGICTAGDVNYVGNKCSINTDCGASGGVCTKAPESNIIDIEAFKYVSTFISSTWTRKTVTFKTSLDTYYLNVLPVLSGLLPNVGSSTPATAVFDAIQLQEGSNAGDYSLYENSKINYLKKAPDYANCYSSSTSKDKVFCSNFIKSCEKKDVGCRRYEKKDNSDYWLPGKPTEENYCSSECKGYELYKEGGPSYDPVAGSSFQSLISTTAKSCDLASSGCSEYKNLNNGELKYYSFIRACLKESDVVGSCKLDPYIGKTCINDDGCGGVAGSCEKASSNYVDYFTYTGSETSGYKLNVYRLLRTKVCSATASSANPVSCFSDASCSGNGSCVYSDLAYAPATIISDSFDKCDSDQYALKNHNPNCREFHGPKDLTSASGTSGDGYVLYYANMSDIIPVSNKDCGYFNITAYQGTIDKSKCDLISPLSSSVKYQKQDFKTCVSGTNIGKTCSANSDCGGAANSCSYKIIGCNTGIYLPEAIECGKDKLNCREYKGTSTSSETLFSDSFEEGNDSWVFGGSAASLPTISTEDIFVNEHSVKVPYNSFISKTLVGAYIKPKERSLFKVHLYAKNDSPSGTLSNIELKVGNSFSTTKQVNNDWRYISFDIFSSSDISEAFPDIQLINKGLVGSGSVGIFVDYIVLEKSDSVYVIKDTWNTPVSCDNSIYNSTGTCNTQGETNGFCKIVPDKVCLTGTNIGSVCTSANFATVCGSPLDTCDYPNKVCRWGDNKTSSCASDDDCYLDPVAAGSSKTGSCYYTSDGYRLNLGKMIGCDEYLDSYGNDNFYVFNDLNLCSADKMGCEALYDTKNSSSYQKQEFNKNVDYSGMVAYYTFDDRNNFAKNDFSGVSITNNNKAIYVGDGVSDGAVSFDGTNSLSETISASEDNAIKSINSNMVIYGWIKPSATTNSTIVSLPGKYSVTISGGKIVCNIGGFTATSQSSIVNNKWQNFVCSYDGDRARLYVDGVFIKSSDGSGYINLGLIASELPKNLSIGTSFKGSIDDIRIYNKFFDSKDAYYSFIDNKDDFTVSSDQLGYYIIDNNFACDAKNKGCSAVGRTSDRYDSANASYTTAYYIIDPDKFKSSGNYAVSGVYDGSMCKINEEGCYSFADDSGSTSYFKFPKNVCVYKTQVNTGETDDHTEGGIVKQRDGWFKYDVDSKTVSNVGCYFDKIKDIYNDDSYKIKKASDCEYRKEPVVVKRTFEDDGSGGKITRPKQTTYYVYSGVCSNDSSRTCVEDSECNGSCLLERTNAKCSTEDVIAGRKDCKPYGYDENSGVIDQYSNTSFEFKVCQSGTKVGSYCNTSSDCSGAACGEPWTVIGWFKVNSTKGCSDNGNIAIEATDYMRDYNDSVGICNEYGCSEFVEPTEKRCISGNLDGYDCSSDSDCGSSGVCSTDSSNGAKYCKARINGDAVNKINSSCVFDKDCGFGGICQGNNVYSYIKNSKINSGNCNGTVSRESGCILFNDTTNPQLSFSSKLTYAAVKNGVAVAAVTGDNSGGDSQKDSNMIISVSRDRECSEWLTFDSQGSPTDSGYNPSSGNALGGCTKLSKDNKCANTPVGNSWGGANGEETLGTKFYLSEMRGEWFDRDFSGMAVPGRVSLNYKKSSDYWWKSSDARSGTITYVLRGADVESNSICKAYPETDSPYNFKDKFDITQLGAGYNSGTTTLDYAKYKDLAPRDYFKNVNTGVTFPYGDNSTFNNTAYRIDNTQDCYYQKVEYKDVLNPKSQYLGIGVHTIPSALCYNTSTGVNVSGSNNHCDDASATLERKVADYTTSINLKGYCLEYDYSKEIYYKGSGKYNCLTWVPGFISGR